jgi:hypothetical protein
MTEKEILAVVRTYFPNALTTSETVNRLLDLIHKHYDIEAKHIMLADSICSDDVNTMEYPQRAYEMLGPFKMGGLNGFPFTGLTGMNAFAHHVPEHGAVVVYYAPHIGITKEGITGEINRIGQPKPSACCGAAKAALTKLLNGAIQEGMISELDYQQNTIEQIFLRQEDRILTSSNPLLEATLVMYEAINDRINLLISKTEYPCKYIILMGGILINGDHDMGSFNACQRFEVIDLRDRKSTDMKQLLLR